MRTVAALSFAIACAAVSSHARAGEPERYISEKPAEPAGKKEGFTPMLKASGTFALSHNRRFVGSQDGLTINFGFIVNGALDYLHPKGHVWSSALDWQLGYLYTPDIEKLSKSIDSFNLTTAYLYKIPKAPFIGPYGSLTLKTSMFPGYKLVAADTKVRKLDESGREIGSYDVQAKGKISLTSFFSPTSLRESVGIFADLIDLAPLKLQMRAGIGVWETFTRDGFAIADDATTKTLASS